MNKNILVFYLFFLCILESCSYSQESVKMTIGDINYYNTEQTDADSYKKLICKLDVNYPTNKTDLPAIIFLHGGGLTSGDKYIPAEFTNQNIIVVSPGYRLSPKAKCSSYIEDAAASIAWVFKHISEYGGNPHKIYLSGYSAGAYLATMVYLDKSYLKKYDLDPDSLAGLFSFSGQMTTHFQVLAESGISAGSDTKIIDNFAPLYHIRKTIYPLVFYTGDSTMDMPGRYVQNLNICKDLTKLGNNNVYYIKFNGKDHSTFLDPAIQNAISFINNSKAYLASVKNSSSLVKLNQTITDTSNDKVTNQYDFSISKNKNSIDVYSKDKIRSVFLYNLKGEKLFHIDKSNSNDVYFNVNRLLKGVYILSVVTEKGTISRKINF